ncbi:hypothetical protein HN873_071577 [Arachis hypogaea]
MPFFQDSAQIESSLCFYLRKVLWIQERTMLQTAWKTHYKLHHNECIRLIWLLLLMGAKFWDLEIGVHGNGNPLGSLICMLQLLG